MSMSAMTLHYIIKRAHTASNLLVSERIVRHSSNRATVNAGRERHLDDEMLKGLVKAVAATDVIAVGQVAIASVAALCAELEEAGALAPEAVDRVRAVLLLAIEQSVGTLNLRNSLTNQVSRQFEAVGFKPN